MKQLNIKYDNLYIDESDGVQYIGLPDNTRIELTEHNLELLNKLFDMYEYEEPYQQAQLKRKLSKHIPLLKNNKFTLRKHKMKNHYSENMFYAFLCQCDPKNVFSFIETLISKSIDVTVIIKNNPINTVGIGSKEAFYEQIFKMFGDQSRNIVKNSKDFTYKELVYYLLDNLNVKPYFLVTIIHIEFSDIRVFKLLKLHNVDNVKNIVLNYNYYCTSNPMRSKLHSSFK